MPTPGEPKLRFPGAAFACRTSSATVVMELSRGTAIKSGDTPMRVIGTKSVSGS